MERMVTRTLTETVVKILSIDAECERVIESEITLPGKIKTKEQAAKVLTKSGVEYARIMSLDTQVKRYGCTEVEFLTIAKEMPMLKAKNESEDNE